MGIINTLFGQPSYTITGDRVSAAITVQGGHLTAQFKTKNGEVNPFFVSPWWNEAKCNFDEVLNVLRGDFFCFPFGGGEDPYKRKIYPLHGNTACDNWDFVRLVEEKGKKEIVLRMELGEMDGKVDKVIRIMEGEPVLYIDHIVEGFSGKMPLGYHPTLKLPDRERSGIIDISEPIAGFTPPEPFENPKNGGYSLLKTGIEITNRKKVPAITGGFVDISRYPTPRGYEDIVMFLSDEKLEFAFSAVSVPGTGYLYFQLKDPKVLAQTLFWMSNGGRHYPPWNGRVHSVLGVEEVTSFFHYGIKRSVEKNFFIERGSRTTLSFDGKTPVHIRLIMGMTAIEKSFKGVAEIRRKNNSTVTVMGKGGERIDVPCRVDFLFEKG